MKSVIKLGVLLGIICSPFFQFKGMPCAYAGMGRIVATDAKVFEESQKAIILHNFDEEVLILGMDLKADKNTSILRFIPFPSEPKVSVPPIKAFSSAMDVIQSHTLTFVGPQYKGGNQTSTQAVELRFNRTLGAHDIAVVKINEAASFRNWVNTFFKTKNLPQKTANSDIESIVDDYTKRGIIYFAFDFVEIVNETRFIEPVEYRFKSKELYYPIKISNTFGEQGAIDLILIVPGTVCNPYFRPDSLGMRATTSSQIFAEELLDVLPESKVFFGTKDLFIQLLEYKGKYEFRKDIFYDLSKVTPHEKSLENYPLRRFKGDFKNGKKAGKWIEKAGTDKYFNSREEGNYIENQREGEWLVEYSIRGNIKKRRLLYDKGKLIKEITLTREEIKYPSGNIKEIYYGYKTENDSFVKHGPDVIMDETNQIVKHLFYQNGQKDTIWTFDSVAPPSGKMK